MLLLAGMLTVFFSMIGGFMLAKGNPLLLAHPSEFVVICGIAAGVMIIACPKDVLMRMIADIKHAFHGATGVQEEFLDLLKLLYEIFMLGRRSGLIALDEHLGDPEHSSIFTKYPSFLEKKERVAFLCNALRPIIDGKIKPEQLQDVLQEEIDAREEEANAGIGVLNLVGDSLPGIGIVAAVLGIINTMSAISEGPEKVGEKVAAALTGTFLGVFLAYGFVNPLAKRIHFDHHLHFLYYGTMVRAISGFARGLAPVMAIEIARRALDSSIQPDAQELESILKALSSKK